MKRTLQLKWLILIILISPIILNAQYFNNINKAELQIINKSYKEALETYLNVVSEYDHLRANDYYNLVLCASLLNEKVIAKQYFDSCLTSGYKLYHFYETPIEKVLSLQTLNEQEKERFNKLEQSFEALKTTVSYKVLEDIVNKDQSFRANDIYYGDSMYYAHGLRLVHLIESDSIIKKPLFDFGRNSTAIPWVLIRHYYGMVNRAKYYVTTDNKHKDFYQTVVTDSSLYFSLKKLIDNGYFHPGILRDGMIYYQPYEQFGYVGYRRLSVYKNLNKSTNYIAIEISFKESYTKKETRQFDKKRQEIGLISYDNEIAFMEYSNVSENQSEGFQMSFVGVSENYQAQDERTRIIKKPRYIIVEKRKDISAPWQPLFKIKKKNIVYSKGI